jgi:hypothetical protein
MIKHLTLLFSYCTAVELVLLALAAMNSGLHIPTVEAIINYKNDKEWFFSAVDLFNLTLQWLRNN